MLDKECLHDLTLVIDITEYSYTKPAAIPPPSVFVHALEGLHGITEIVLHPVYAVH